MQWAKEEAVRSPKKINNPWIVGAVLDLGFCFDLLNSTSYPLLEQYYFGLLDLLNISKEPLPENFYPKDNPTGDKILRELDCAAIEYGHRSRKSSNKKQFDSVRGMFPEGKEVYPNSRFLNKNHFQICIRNPNRIKGWFNPLQLDKTWTDV